MRAVTFAPGASRWAISSTSYSSAAPRCRLLKRILSWAVAEPGITLLALVGVESAVNSRFDGGKSLVTSSWWIDSRVETTRASDGGGLGERLGLCELVCTLGCMVLWI